MSFLELSKERYSVRKFTDDKVESDKLEQILLAGRYAPTATNSQPQRIYIADSEDSMSKLAECTPYCFNAKTAIILCYDKNESWKRKHDNYDGGTIDASIVGTHMMMQIADMGLGTTWVGYFDSDKLKEVFQLEENIIPVGIFPIGYIADDSEPSQKHYIRKELDETVTFI